MDSQYKTEEREYKSETQEERYQGKFEEREEAPKQVKLAYKDTYDLPKGGGIIGKPLIIGDRIYTGSCDFHMYCLDKEDGRMIWKFETGGVIISSAVLYNGRIYFSSNDKYIYCIDEDGKLVWKFLTGDISSSTPLIIGNKLFAGSGDGFLYCLDTETGKRIWSFQTGNAISNSVSTANNCIYFGSYDGYLYCIDMDGTLVWKQMTYSSISGRACPIITDNEFRTISGFKNRVLESSPELAKGYIFFGSRDKNMYCFTLDGRKVWQFMADGFVSNHAVVDNGYIYFGGADKNLHYVDARTGKEKWKTQTGGMIFSTPIKHKGIVFFGSFDKNLYALDAENGKILWAFTTGGECFSPVVDEGNIYFGSLDTHLYSLNIKERKVNWTFQTGFGRGIDIETIVNKLVEFDRNVFKVWKPETTGAKSELSEKQYKAPKPQDIPQGMIYGGEQTYTSSVGSYTSGSSVKKDKKPWE